MVFLKYVSHFEIFWPLPPWRHFQGCFHLQPSSTCAYEVTISTDFKAAVEGIGHWAAAFLLSPFWELRKESFLPVVFLGYILERNVPGQTPKSWCLLTYVWFLNWKYIYFFIGVIFHCVHGPLLLCAFLCWQTFLLLPSVGCGKYCWSAGLPPCVFWILILSGDRPSSGYAWLNGSSIFTLSRHLLCVFITGSYHVPLRNEGAHFSTTPSAFIVCRIFADGHYDWCELIVFCNLDLHVFNNS